MNVYSSGPKRLFNFILWQENNFHHGHIGTIIMFLDFHYVMSKNNEKLKKYWKIENVFENWQKKHWRIYSSEAKRLFGFILGHTHGHNGAYWYCIHDWSFGFSPVSELSLDSDHCDISNNDPEYRLSWNVRGEFGGYRAGVHIGLYNDKIWRKIIKTGPCPCNKFKWRTKVHEI